MGPLRRSTLHCFAQWYVPNTVPLLRAPFARPKELSPNTGHGHHWFGNAESYFLIGDALGKAMVKLLEAAETN